MAEIIDGQRIAAQILEEVRQEVEELRQRGVLPRLTVLMLGEDPASSIYVRNKSRACQQVGVESEVRKLPLHTPEGVLLSILDELNCRRDVHGVLVQLPLPEKMDQERVLLAISPEKDVDGFHPLNVGKLVLGNPAFLPCTAAGVVELLSRTGHHPRGRHVVVVGRSHIVGQPLANLLMQKGPWGNATVTVCHTRTSNLSHHTRQAEILVVAAGKPELIVGEMVSEGAVVVDVGIHQVEDSTSARGYRLVGDVHFDSVSEKASAITPVPGGVGPMTVAMLLVNAVRAARKQSG